MLDIFFAVVDLVAIILFYLYLFVISICFLRGLGRLHFYEAIRKYQHPHIVTQASQNKPDRPNDDSASAVRVEEKDDLRIERSHKAKVQENSPQLPARPLRSRTRSHQQAGASHSSQRWNNILGHLIFILRVFNGDRPVVLMTAFFITALRNSFNGGLDSHPTWALRGEHHSERHGPSRFTTSDSETVKTPKPPASLSQHPYRQLTLDRARLQHNVGKQNQMPSFALSVSVNKSDQGHKASGHSHNLYWKWLLSWWLTTVGQHFTLYAAELLGLALWSYLYYEMELRIPSVPTRDDLAELAARLRMGRSAATGSMPEGHEDLDPESDGAWTSVLGLESSTSPASSGDNLPHEQHTEFLFWRRFVWEALTSSSNEFVMMCLKVILPAAVITLAPPAVLNAFKSAGNGTLAEAAEIEPALSNDLEPLAAIVWEHAANFGEWFLSSSTSLIWGSLTGIVAILLLAFQAAFWLSWLVAAVEGIAALVQKPDELASTDEDRVTEPPVEMDGYDC